MYGPDGLNELLAISDYVVVAIALTEETEGMLGREQFKHSKKGQILINVGRGPVIVEDDLIEALQNGKTDFAGFFDPFAIGELYFVRLNSVKISLILIKSFRLCNTGQNKHSESGSNKF